MKKRIIPICLLLICVLMLASCDALTAKLGLPPKNAEQLMARIESRMDSYESYRADIQIPFCIYYDSYKIEGDITGIIIEDRAREDDYYSYMEMSAEMASPQLDYSTSFKTVDAYHEGNAFTSYVGGTTSCKLYSPLTPEQYLAYREGDSVTDIDFTDCDNVEFAKTDNGYSLTFSGYSAQVMADFSENSGLKADEFGEPLKDMTVTIETDESCTVTKFSLEMIFDVTEYTRFVPEFSMTMTFSQFDAVERITSSINPARYTKLDDVRPLKQLGDMLDDRIDADSGSFVLTQTDRLSILNEVYEANETDTVTFSRSEDGYEFSVDFESDEGHGTIRYKDGKNTVGLGGESTSVDMTDAEAEAFVENLIRPATLGGYDRYLVADIKATENGYAVTMLVTSSGNLAKVIESYGGQFQSGTHTIDFTVKDGKITAMTTVFEAKGTVNVNNGSSATLSVGEYSTLTFHD